MSQELSSRLSPVERATVRRYSFLWRRKAQLREPRLIHAAEVLRVLPRGFARGARWLDIGCGLGHDALWLARQFPQARVTAVDFSEVTRFVRRRINGLPNVEVVRGNARALPFPDRQFDFLYAFGVFHHLEDPQAGVREMCRVAKPQARFAVYLYEDHAEHLVKRWAIRLIAFLRRLTSPLPPPIVYGVAWLVSPIMVILFRYLAYPCLAILRGPEQARRVPFAFATHPWSVVGDLYDRFATPVEHRFSRDHALHLFRQSGCREVLVTSLPGSAGLIIYGVVPSR